MLWLLGSVVRWLSATVAVVVVSVVAPALLLGLITAPVLLRSFGPVIPPGIQPLLCAVFWVLALVALGGVNHLAERFPDRPALGIFAGALVLAAVPLIPTAVFAWQALTDQSYERHGGIASCTVVAVEERVEEYQSPMTGANREELSYVHTLSCDVAEVTAWTSGDRLAASAEPVRFEYDSSGRFELRPFEAHRDWRSSARIALGLFAASTLLYLVVSAYALRREALDLA